MNNMAIIKTFQIQLNVYMNNPTGLSITTSTDFLGKGATVFNEKENNSSNQLEKAKHFNKNGQKTWTNISQKKKCK